MPASPDPSATPEKPLVTVGALVQEPEGRILLVRTWKWNHMLGVPGGKIEWGETQEQALRRELREETGLEIEHPIFLLAQDCISSPEFYKNSHMLLLNYFCRTSSIDVTLNEEAEEFFWVSPGEALKMDLNAPTRVLVEAFLQRYPQLK